MLRNTYLMIRTKKRCAKFDEMQHQTASLFIKIEKKSFQFFPLQSSGIPRHIQVDTKSLCELFIETGKHQEKLDIWIKTTINKKGEVNNKTKKDLYYCLEENQEFIWDTFFNITQKILELSA